MSSVAIGDPGKVAQSATEAHGLSDAHTFVPLPVRPVHIVAYYQMFKAHGQKRPPTHCFISATWFRGNSDSQTAFVTRKSANAGLQQLKTRHDDGQQTFTNLPNRYTRGVCQNYRARF
jgi:hypothetical protein